MLSLLSQRLDHRGGDDTIQPAFHDHLDLPHPTTLHAIPPHLQTQLGPTFIKIGQALSIRTDLLNPTYADALCQLQDRVPAFPNEKVNFIKSSCFRSSYLPSLSSTINSDVGFDTIDLSDFLNL